MRFYFKLAFVNENKQYTFHYSILHLSIFHNRCTIGVNAKDSFVERGNEFLSLQRLKYLLQETKDVKQK